MDKAVFQSTHRKVIAYLHILYKQSGKRFAIWEVRHGADVSSSSVTRILKELVELKLVRHYEKGFMGRNYEVTQAWDTDIMKVIEVFELRRVLNL